MEHQRLFIWICFALCLSLTAGGILSLFRFGHLKNLSAYKYLQYYLILIYTFGYYGLWSEVILSIFPNGLDVLRFSRVIIFMSMPFFYIGLVMISFWIKYLAKKSTSTLLIIVFSLTPAVLILMAFSYAGWEFISMPSDIFNAHGFIFWFLSSFIFLSIKTQVVEAKPKTLLVINMLLIAVFHFLNLLTFESSSLTGSTYIFLFFLLYTSLAVVFIYTAKVEENYPEQMFGLSLEKLVEKFNITNREQEIIIELNKGKTNQEIADTLFITLQTVKDHTSRIYLKTHSKNRTQLISKIRFPG